MFRRSNILWLLLCVMALGASACQPRQMTMDDEPADVAPSLAQGKQIYYQQCTRCHAAEPINDYSQDEWQAILPDMIRVSRLKPQQAADVRAYVMSELR